MCRNETALVPQGQRYVDPVLEADQLDALAARHEVGLRIGVRIILVGYAHATITFANSASSTSGKSHLIRRLAFIDPPLWLSLRILYHIFTQSSQIYSGKTAEGRRGAR